MGSADLVLKMACEGCGNTSDLYGTGGKHTTLCSDCGKAMARSPARCLVCSAPITRLIRVRIHFSALLFFTCARSGSREGVRWHDLATGSFALAT